MKNINKSTLKNLVIILTQFDRYDPYFKAGLDRWVRDTTQRNQYYGFSDLLKEELIKYNLYPNEYITPSQAKKLSKKLKGFISDEIMIEHWKEIAEMKSDLMNMYISNNMDNAIQQIESYFINETDCFYRLTKKENHLQKRYIK